MFTPDNNNQLQIFPKSDTTRDFLKFALSSHYLFEKMEDDAMKKIIDCMSPILTSAEEAIIRQGDKGDLFYCLEVGSAYATVNNENVATYEPGGCFGELALIYNSPRAASIVSKTACKLWGLDLKYV